MSVTPRPHHLPAGERRARRLASRSIVSIVGALALVTVAAGCGDDEATGPTEEFCQRVEDLPSQAVVADEQSLTDLTVTLQRLEEVAPDDVSSDIDTMLASLEELNEQLAATDVDDPVEALEAAMALAEFDQEQFSQAANNLAGYVERNCDIAVDSG